MVVEETGIYFVMSTASTFPASPAHGPFFPLLQQHPEIGLELIRKFAHHAVQGTGGAGETPAFTIYWARRTS